MNKKTLALTLGGAIATVLTTTPLVHAQENPFGMKTITLAQADAKMPEGTGSEGKMKEGKCGEGKCGANKSKMKEAGSQTDAKPMDKMKEGGCSDKMKEASCSNKK